MRLAWFLLTGHYDRGPIQMADVDLENRIWREQRLPLHEASTDQNNGSSVVRGAAHGIAPTGRA